MTQTHQQTRPSQRAPIRVPFFYGWVIVAVCFTASFFAGATSQLFMSIMVVPLQDEMGWSRTELAGALTIGVIATAALSPVLGRLCDRYGPRVLMSVGSVIVAGGFFGLASLNSLWQFYASYIIGRGVAQAAMGGVVPSTAITNWFDRKRGRTVGLTSTAFQLSSTVMIPVAQLLIAAGSWRAVYWILGAGTALFVMAPAALLLRRRPEDLGLLPDGERTAGSGLRTQSPSPRAGRAGDRGGAGGTQSSVRSPESFHNPASSDFTVREAMATSTFWFLVAAQFLSVLISGSLTFHLVAYFTGTGVDPLVAALAASLFALASGLSSAIWGALSDRFSERRLGIVSTLLGGAGVVMMILSRGDLMALLVSTYYGLVARSQGSILNLIIARYFGRSSYGAISGTLGPIAYVGLGLGPLLGSIAYDRFGSYTGYLTALVACHLLAALCLAMARRPAPPFGRLGR